MACASCGVEGPWTTCPVCAGDEVGAVEAGLIPDPREEPEEAPSPLPPRYAIGLSVCCGAHPFRVNSEPWRCGSCNRVCDRVADMSKDPVMVQLEQVARIARQEGYVGASAWILNRMAQGSVGELALKAASGVRQV